MKTANHPALTGFPGPERKRARRALYNAENYRRARRVAGLDDAPLPTPSLAEQRYQEFRASLGPLIVPDVSVASLRDENGRSKHGRPRIL